jgi:hypothetical protein
MDADIIEVIRRIANRWGYDLVPLDPGPERNDILEGNVWPDLPLFPFDGPLFPKYWS